MRNFRISFLPPGEKERISITMRASCEEALKKFFTDDMAATFETLTEVEKLTKPWDFVEKFYPNYSSCSTIMYCGDLHKIVDGELTGTALEMWETFKLDQPSWIDKDDLETIIFEKIQEELEAVETTIYKKAILGYIESSSEFDESKLK